MADVLEKIPEERMWNGGKQLHQSTGSGSANRITKRGKYKQGKIVSDSCIWYLTELGSVMR